MKSPARPPTGTSQTAVRGVERRPRLEALPFLLAALLAALAAAAPAQVETTGYATAPPADLGVAGADADFGTGYSYLRTLDGSVTIFQSGSGVRSAAAVNQAILTGDRLWAAPGARAEVALADGNLARVEGETEIVFDRVAYSSDSQDRTTVLRLLSGDLQLVVVDGAVGDELPRVDTPNASLYAQGPGSFRIGTSGADWTWVVSRGGALEVLTPSGSTLVRSGEELTVSGGTHPQVAVGPAAGLDGLEEWGDRLSAEAAAADTGYVDPDLAYAAAPLAEHGSWVEVEGDRAWRPAVSVSWRPYSVGTWSYTPSGLFWVSGDPWGWVTDHYGYWDHGPGYGWLWHPGHRFAPAWVYWYWGPSWVGWCPIGYYRSFYYPRYHHFGHGLRSGVYGWAGGSFGSFQHWSFAPHLEFGRGGHRGHFRSGSELARSLGERGLERGLITTDTRAARPERWGRPTELVQALQKERSLTGRSRLDADLPDVTPFVARQASLPTSVVDRVVARETAGDRVAPDRVLAWREARAPRGDDGRPAAVGAPRPVTVGAERPDQHRGDLWVPRILPAPTRPSLAAPRPGGDAPAPPVASRPGSRPTLGEQPASIPDAPRGRPDAMHLEAVRIEPTRNEGVRRELTTPPAPLAGPPPVQDWRQRAPRALPPPTPPITEPGTGRMLPAPPVVQRVVGGIRGLQAVPPLRTPAAPAMPPAVASPPVIAPRGTIPARPALPPSPAPTGVRPGSGSVRSPAVASPSPPALGVRPAAPSGPRPVVTPQRPGAVQRPSPPPRKPSGGGRRRGEQA